MHGLIEVQLIKSRLLGMFSGKGKLQFLLRKGTRETDFLVNSEHFPRKGEF